jgi:hypothetical protein
MIADARGRPAHAYRVPEEPDPRSRDFGGLALRLG